MVWPLCHMFMSALRAVGEHSGKGSKVEQDKFVAEGFLEIGPYEKYFLFLDGEWLAHSLMKHFRVPEERGYKQLGRVRITVEKLED